MNRVLPITVGAFAATFAAIYPIAWYIQGSAARKEVHGALALWHEDGADIAADELEVTGFPWDVNVHLAHVRANFPEGALSWDAVDLRVNFSSSIYTLALSGGGDVQCVLMLKGSLFPPLWDFAPLKALAREDITTAGCEVPPALAIYQPLYDALFARTIGAYVPGLRGMVSTSGSSGDSPGSSSLTVTP